MGHQVNFYLDPADTAELESVWRSFEPMIVLHSRSPSEEPLSVHNVRHVEDGEPWLYYYLVRPDELPAVRTMHVPAQRYWAIDELRSPVIQFSGCFFDDTVLGRGRLYYVDGFYNAAQVWELKPERFRLWAKVMLGKTRKALTKRQTNYIGAGAASWLTLDGHSLVD
jgi:hypothetical protein